MVTYQPAHRFGFLRREAEPRTQLQGQRGAKLGMIAIPALGDVMQQGRHEQGPARLDFRHHRGRHRCRLGKTAILDLVEDADDLNGMLVDSVAVIHVELHHRDDLAEIGKEAAQHAALIHQAEHAFGIVFRCQNGKEFLGRPRVIPRGVAKRMEATRDPLQRLRVNVGFLVQCQMKYFQHPQRRITKHQLGVEIDPPGPDAKMPEILATTEIGRPAKAALAEIGFHRRANDTGEVSDIARRQIIAFHETFDITHAAARGKAH